MRNADASGVLCYQHHWQTIGSQHGQGSPYILRPLRIRRGDLVVNRLHCERPMLLPEPVNASDG